MINIQPAEFYLLKLYNFPNQHWIELCPSKDNILFTLFGGVHYIMVKYPTCSMQHSLISGESHYLSLHTISLDDYSSPSEEIAII